MDRATSATVACFCEVYKFWREESFKVFDELPDAAFVLWCKDGAVVVHPAAGTIDAVTVNVHGNSSGHFQIRGAVSRVGMPRGPK